jgi:anti-anti-sigma factor
MVAPASAAVYEGTLLPVRWVGTVAVVALPEHIDASNSAEIREALLTLINRGASVVVADMTGTLSCDHGGADALMRAYHRAAGNGTQLRLVVTAPIVRRVLDASGLDRLLSIYPSAEAALAAGAPGDVIPLVPRPASGRGNGPRSASTAAQRREARLRVVSRDRAAVTPAVLWRVVDALDDGVLLSDDDGIVALGNRRLEEMFGYPHGELAGKQVSSLMPDYRRIRRDARAAAAAGPTATRGRLVGLRKDGGSFPVHVSVSLVPTATGRFTLTVVKDVSRPHLAADLVDLARNAAETGHAHRAGELLDRIVNDLHKVGMSLQDAIDLPHDQAKQRIAAAVRQLDDTVREIRDHVFGAGGADGPPGGQ